MTKDEKTQARKELAEKAVTSYDEGHTLMEVADELGVSYGKAHALVKEAGGVIRPRGHRFVAPEAVVDTAPDPDAGDQPLGDGNALR